MGKKNSGRPVVGKSIKRRLVCESGGKCANPGCPNRLTEIHHIKEWHVVQTHNPDDMIAICASCHDAVSRGSLRVDDETAYSWKRIIRSDRDSGAGGHIYVEPSRFASPKLLLGSVAFQGESDLIIFSTTPERLLSFKVIDGNIMHLNAHVMDVHGSSLFTMKEGHFWNLSNGKCKVQQRPGRVRVTHSLAPEIVPQWALQKIRLHAPSFAENGSIPIIDIEVIEPNLVRIQGTWMRNNSGIVITKRHLSFIFAQRPEPTSLSGDGVNSVMDCQGPIDKALFKLAGDRVLLYGD